jgi:hypothetical protein
MAIIGRPVIDFDTVHLDLEKDLASANKDPEDVVTAASSTLKSVCRSVLGELELPLPAKEDIAGLYKALVNPSTWE